MAINMNPSELDPVFAADTPITPDPVVRAPVPARKATGGIGWVVRGNTPRDEMIKRLVNAGMTDEEAARIVDGELDRSGGRPRALFDQDNSPQGNAALAERVKGLRRIENRQARFAADYNAATGMPSAPSAAAPFPSGPRMAPVPQMDAGPAPLTMTEPGVRMPDGSRVTPPRAIYNEDEAAAYNIRTPNGSPGLYNPSGRDDAMRRRGYVPVENEDGTVSYRLGPGGEIDGLPGTPGRGGRREDLEAPLLKADGTPVLDANRKPVPRFRVQNMPGPLSENNSVYVQSKEAKAKQDAYMRERQLYRDAQTLGVSPAELLATSPGDYGNLTAGGQRGRVNARVANEGARQAQAAKQKEAWRAQMMLAGGRPTGGIGGSKATVNAWLNLPEDQRDSAMRYMLPGGQLSATVDANNAAQAGRMAQAAMTAFLNNNPQGAPLNPLQQNQLDDKKAQQRQEAVQWAEGHVSSNYAEPQGIGNWLNRGAAAIGLPVHDNTEFTVAEQDKAIAALRARYPNLTLAEATQIIDSVGATRTTRPRAAPAAPAPAGAAPAGMPVPPARGDL
jgi:hypothetical protein